MTKTQMIFCKVSNEYFLGVVDLDKKIKGINRVSLSITNYKNLSIDLSLVNATYDKYGSIDNIKESYNFEVKSLKDAKSVLEMYNIELDSTQSMIAKKHFNIK